MRHDRWVSASFDEVLVQPKFSIGAVYHRSQVDVMVSSLIRPSWHRQGYAGIKSQLKVRCKLWATILRPRGA